MPVDEQIIMKMRVYRNISQLGKELLFGDPVRCRQRMIDRGKPRGQMPDQVGPGAFGNMNKYQARLLFQRVQNKLNDAALEFR